MLSEKLQLYLKRRIFEPNYDPDSVDAETSSSSSDDDVSSSSSSGGHGYCDEPMYKFAFSLLLIGYIILAMAIAFSCCGCCVAGCMACALAAGSVRSAINKTRTDFVKRPAAVKLKTVFEFPKVEVQRNSQI